MSGEDGQASVEWIALLLLLALGLAALVRFAPRADAEALGPELLHAIGCGARGGCDAAGRGGDPRGGARPGGATPPGAGPPGDAAPRGAGPPGGAIPRGMVSAPPLVPVMPRQRQAPAARPRGGRLRGGPLLRGRALLRGAGRRAGVLWRRSWILCLGYERARYAFLNPEQRFPGAAIPLSEDLRMVNDCLSPVDLVRDWHLFTGSAP